MTKETFFARCNRPVRYSEFWFPGLILLFISLPFLFLGFYSGWSAEPIQYGAVRLIAATLLLFRTRIGTTLYFYLLFASVAGRFEEGIDLSTAHSWFRLGLGAIMFYTVASLGWSQITYHFDRYRHRSCA